MTKIPKNTPKNTTQTIQFIHILKKMQQKIKKSHKKFGRYIYILYLCPRFLEHILLTK